MIVAPIPTSTSSSMTQPCRVQWWVIEQLRPMVVPVREPTWIITKSWMLLFSPMTTASLSARATTLHQIEAPAPISTAPNSRADGSIHVAPRSRTSGPRKAFGWLIVFASAYRLMGTAKLASPAGR